MPREERAWCSDPEPHAQHRWRRSPQRRPSLCEGISPALSVVLKWGHSYNRWVTPEQAYELLEALDNA